MASLFDRANCSGRPHEVAELIAFLADRSKSEYIVGQCIVIDGGASLHLALFQHITEMKE